MAVMVWCQSCKKVVYAYDHEPSKDIRGWLNEVRIPCPLCGTSGNFNGWGSTLVDSEGLPDLPDVYDMWSLMRHIAKEAKVEWCPNGNNLWFRPEGDYQVFNKKEVLKG